MANGPDDTFSTSAAGGVAGVLAEIRREVRGLVETLWAARDADELMDTVVEVEALKSTLDALELSVVRELEATGAVKQSGWASTQDFVTHAAGGHKGTGPATVRLAAAVAEPVLEPVGAALADGWLSTRRPRSSNAQSTHCPEIPGSGPVASRCCWPTRRSSTPPS